MTSGTATRSTAEAQRALITSAAVHVFARKGLHATPVADVAAAAGVSPAYVFRLFDGKEGLFVAAVRHTYALVEATLRDAGAASASTTPEGVLDAMTEAYVRLIADRDLILMQSHAQAATDVAAVRAAVHEGLGAVVEAVAEGSGAAPDAVQRFIAYGQLCHLVVQADLAHLPHAWASTLTAGIRHRD